MLNSRYGVFYKVRKKWKYEQNKGRAASCRADDTAVLQEEGGQQGVMS